MLSATHYRIRYAYIGAAFGFVFPIIALLLRNNELIMPRGATRFVPGDHLFIAIHRRLRPLIDALFLPADQAWQRPSIAPVPFHESDTVAQIALFYGVETLPEAASTLGALLARQTEGAEVHLGPFRVAPGPTSNLVELTYVDQAL